MGIRERMRKEVDGGKKKRVGERRTSVEYI